MVMRFQSLSLTLAVAAVAWAQPGTNAAMRAEDRCSVEGSVTNASTGEPLRKATVTLRRMPDSANSVGAGSAMLVNAPLSATTDAGGRYTIGNIEPGRYRLSVDRTGFLSQLYGARAGGNSAGTIVTLSAGQKMRDADFRMIAQGVIVGRVLDEDGDPVQDVMVNCMRQTYVRGRRQWVPVKGEMSNDLGEYRVHSLAPGRFLLSATYRTPLVDEQSTGGNGNQESYAPTYYPGATTPESAAPIEVTAGAQLRGMDIRLRKAGTVRLRGRVVGSQKKPTRNTAVRLVQQSDTLFSFSPRMVRQLDPNGGFTLSGVTPGSYWLVGETAEDNELMMGRIPVEVGSASIDDLTLTLSRPGELSGVVKFSGCDVKPSALRGVLEMATFGLGFPGFEVKDDATFAVKNVWSDRYRVRLLGMPVECYVKGVQFGDADVLDAGLNLSQGVPAGQLLVTVSGGAAQVEGSVENDQHQPVGSAWVALIPEGSRRERSEAYILSTTDQNGRYTLKGIVPGEYRVYAFDQIEPGACQDREFMKPWEGRGEKVTLQEKGHETLKLKLINTNP